MDPGRRGAAPGRDPAAGYTGLSCSGGSLEFTVTDDGTGFDPATTRHGTGLQGMADRLATLGGALQVRSRPGHGTTLSGVLPVSAPDPG